MGLDETTILGDLIPTLSSVDLERSSVFSDEVPGFLLINGGTGFHLRHLEGELEILRTDDSSITDDMDAIFRVNDLEILEKCLLEGV